MRNARDEDLTVLIEDVEVPPQPDMLNNATPLAQVCQTST